MSLFIVVFVSFFLVGIYLFSSIRFPKKTKRTIDLKSITVIIPFRNEKEHLPALIDSIKKQKDIPRLLFVNDHSEDGGDSLIPSQFELLHLNENQFGKKAALKMALAEVNTEYILTLDADVVLPATYFEHIQKRNADDLIILPLKLKNSTFIEALGAWEVYFLHAINFSIAAFMKPLVAYGANLLAKTDLVLKAMQSKEYQSEASGDDYFLLRFAKKAKSNIQVCANSSLAVSTSNPKTYKELLNQRVRWAKKTGRVVDVPAFVFTMLGLFYHFSFYSLLLFYPFYIELITLKLLIDLLIVTVYLIRIKSLNNSVLFWLTSLMYPFHFLILLASIPFYTPKWKNR